MLWKALLLMYCARDMSGKVRRKCKRCAGGMCPFLRLFSINIEHWVEHCEEQVRFLIWYDVMLSIFNSQLTYDIQTC